MYMCPEGIPLHTVVCKKGGENGCFQLYKQMNIFESQVLYIKM